MCCDCEVMDFDGEDMSVMMGPSNLNVYDHRFINTSTIETTKGGPHKGHNRKYMEVEGPFVIYYTTVHSELNYSLTKKTI